MYVHMCVNNLAVTMFVCHCVCRYVYICRCIEFCHGAHVGWCVNSCRHWEMHFLFFEPDADWRAAWTVGWLHYIVSENQTETDTGDSLIEYTLTTHTQSCIIVTYCTRMTFVFRSDPSALFTLKFSYVYILLRQCVCTDFFNILQIKWHIPTKGRTNTRNQS